MNSPDYKARCLALLDEMEQRGEQIVITRRGRPVAVLGPVSKDARKSPANSWKRKAEITGDIVNIDTASLWDVTSAK